MPATQDPDDVFLSIVEGIEFDEPDIASVSDLDNLALSAEFNAIRAELHERGEIPHAHSQKGRDLHSRYYALMLEMRKRNM